MPFFEPDSLKSVSTEDLKFLCSQKGILGELLFQYDQKERKLSARAGIDFKWLPLKATHYDFLQQWNSTGFVYEERNRRTRQISRWTVNLQQVQYLKTFEGQTISEKEYSISSWQVQETVFTPLSFLYRIINLDLKKFEETMEKSPVFLVLKDQIGTLKLQRDKQTIQVNWNSPKLGTRAHQIISGLSFGFEEKSERVSVIKIQLPLFTLCFQKQTEKMYTQSD